MKKSDIDIWSSVLDILAYLMRIKNLSEKVLYNFNLKLSKLEKIIIENYGESAIEKIRNPVIFFCDEYIAKKFQNINNYKLQENILGCSNGGDKFFSLLDEVLTKNSSFIIYRLFLLLLREGFCGKYQGNHLAILNYIHNLEDKLKAEDVTNTNTSNLVANNTKEGVFSLLISYIDELRLIDFLGLILAIYFASCLLFYQFFS